MKPTPYVDINQVLETSSKSISEIFKYKLVGIYLFGSLSYGDFNPESSDIDLMTILKSPATNSELEEIKKLHLQVEQKYPTWAKRIENSYTPLSMLSSILPPIKPRPYYGEGIFYPEAEYGNEWIINLYLLYNHGIALAGPPIKDLIKKPIDIKEVQKACVRDLYKEWEPKLRDPDWLNNSHYQSYLVLNLSRIMHTVMNSAASSKKVSAIWVKKQFPEWKELIEIAENWHYGVNMEQKEKTLDFLRFVIKKIQLKKLDL